MSIQYFKRQRGGVSPAGWVQPHIYKDPPKAVFTRKYEPVNIGDVQYMVMNDSQYGDPTRFNESIQVYARGQNPMVEISYQNAGGGSTNSSLGNSQVSNPYKIEVVRPPITPLEALQPISAPRMHQNYSITTNPGIFPTTIAGEYDRAKVRLMTEGYTIPAGNVRSNLNASINMAREREVEKVGKELNEILKGVINPVARVNLDLTRDVNNKYLYEVGNALNTSTTSAMNLPSSISSMRDTSTKQVTETGEALNVSASSQLALQGYNSRDHNNKYVTETGLPIHVSTTAQASLGAMNNGLRESSTKLVRETGDALNTSTTSNIRFLQNAMRDTSTKYVREVGDSNVLSYTPNITMQEVSMRDLSNKYVTETKDVREIAATAPISFTDVVVYDPKTNTNIMVEANIREKNAIAITANASLPLYLNTNDGQMIKLKDYEYRTVVAPAGNTQLQIYVRQPDVKLERNLTLYAANTNLSLKGLDESASAREAAKKIQLESVLPLISATSSVKLNGYNESQLRNSYDPSKMHLTFNTPQTSGSTNITLNAQGYNEELARSSKVKELDRQTQFGSWDNDRIARPDFMLRGIA